MTADSHYLLIFDSKIRENFFPLTHARPSCDLLFGTETLRESIQRKFGTKTTHIYVPKYLESYSKELHPELKVNEPISSGTVFVSSLISHHKAVWKFVLDALNDSSSDVAYRDPAGNLVFGKLSGCDPAVINSMDSSKAAAKGDGGSKIRPASFPAEIAQNCLIKYPWELLRDNSAKIEQDYLDKAYKSPAENFRRDTQVKGKQVSVAESAEIERFVTLDATNGSIIIDDDALVQSFTHIAGPAYVGKNAKIRSAKIREGTTIGEYSKAAGEIEATVISAYSNKSHDGFLGHSYVGSWVNLGALTTNSDLKNTYGKISMQIGRKVVETGEIKIGVFLGDMSKTAIGTLLASAKKVGTGSQVFGFVSEDVPSFAMYGKSLGAKSSEVILESALTTQRRMMQRRNLVMSEAMVSLIRSIYKMTKGERANQRVSKARFKLP